MIIVCFACRQVKDDLQPGHAACTITISSPNVLYPLRVCVLLDGCLFPSDDDACLENHVMSEHWFS